MPKVKISRSSDLQEIFLKCLSEDQRIQYCLKEGNMKYMITEAIDQEDIGKVRTAIQQANKQIDTLDKYLDGFKNLDRNKIQTIDVYIGSLKDALDKASSELANASFESGAISSFFGQKVTLPQITQAAVSLHTKAADFGTGFSNTIKNIRQNLDPLIKDPDQRSQPLSSLAGTAGMPSEDKVRTGITKAMTSALGGGFFKKFKAFFSKSMSGAEKKIMATLPKMDVSTMANELADALMSSTMEDLERKLPDPPATEPTDLQDVAAESQEQELEEPKPEGEPAAEESTEGEPAPASPEEADDAQAAATEELTAAAQAEAGAGQSPLDAVLGTIDNWYSGLSKTSQASLNSKNRLGSLKDALSASFDGLTDVVEKAISDAITDWRSENEETLLKSKRFAKKNFDQLQKIIPDLASTMLKKTNESGLKLTKQAIRRNVWKYLDRKFKKGNDNLLRESRLSDEDMVLYRINKLAGLKNE